MNASKTNWSTVVTINSQCKAMIEKRLILAVIVITNLKLWPTKNGQQKRLVSGILDPLLQGSQYCTTGMR